MGFWANNFALRDQLAQVLQQMPADKANQRPRRSVTSSGKASSHASTDQVATFSTGIRAGVDVRKAMDSGARAKVMLDMA